MEIKRIRVLRGPNLWTRRTAMEAIVSLSDNERSFQGIADLEARLQHRFPTLGYLRHSNSEGKISLAHVLERVALTLQLRAGCLVSFCRTLLTCKTGVYQVVVEYSVEDVGRQALERALLLCRAALAGEPFDLAEVISKLRAIDEEFRPGPSTGSIMRAARDRGIPARRLNDLSLVQLGWGARQRRIIATETDRTSAIAEAIAQDKELTKKLLWEVGVPVPNGRTALDAEDAWAAAREIGVPVVVKPRNGSKGRGVAVNLSTREQVMDAFNVASRTAPSVIVERFIPGYDFRLLAVGGRIVAAARREPPGVTGDGVQTIRQLVEYLNTDPRRSDGHATSLSRITLDDIAVSVLMEQGYKPESVPPPGVQVLLRRNANLSTGGSATDVTEEVHPEVAARAVEAASAVGLDVCGVDVLCERIDAPLEAQSGAVVEVNAAPGFRMHIDPSCGKGRPVGQAVISAMFEDGDDGRIPLVAVSGTNGKTTTVRLINHLLRTGGKHVGMTCSDGIYVDDRQIEAGDCSGPKSARTILLHPDMEAVVFETARGGILREGLAFDRCDVAVVTNIGTGDHLGLAYITTVEELAVIKQVIVRNVSATGTAVLNAADPLTASMADSCPGSVTFFACDAACKTLAAHRARGDRVVYADRGCIVAAQGTREERFDLAFIPLTKNGAIRFQVENSMAAIAAAWSLGIDFNTIRTGLRTFDSDVRTVPGRFNVMQYRGATVIADYGHNPNAMTALVDAVDSIQARRRIIVISAAGDRRDSDIRRQGEIIGDAFDEVILFQDMCQRGRKDGEVLALLREGLAKAGRASAVREIRGELLAIDVGLARLRRGDLVLVLIDQVEKALSHIEKRIGEHTDFSVPPAFSVERVPYRRA